MQSFCTPIDLVCENLINPMGLDETSPRLSWKMADDRPGAKQVAWRIQAATSAAALETKADCWDTGRKTGDTCLDIVYAGKKLASRSTVYWRVKVWDLEGVESDWSEVASFEMGLLKSADWKALWIGAKPMEKEPSPCLRKEFSLKSAPVKARLYITAKGLYETHLNGKRVGEDYFTPGWTDYNKRIHYLVYDVTGLLKAGQNAASAMLGNGWFAGRLGWGNQRHYYGDQTALLYQLEVSYEDGTTERMVSDGGWKTAFGPVVSSDLYDGETYDARREIGGWQETGFNDAGWANAQVFASTKAKLQFKPNLPVRKQEVLPARVQTEPKFGLHIFDLGQNMVGWARVTLRNMQENDVVTVRFGEMLNSDGTLYTANLRSAKSTDTYICRGAAEVVWEPRFTFHGFRYVEITGVREKPELSDVSGIVLHSEMPAIGSFDCSNPVVNRLQQNILWGQKGNFLEAPTDCPQRDERLGWTGDAQVFIRTASFNRDVTAFFEKWCADITDAQFDTGVIPHVVPDVLRSKDKNKYDEGNGCAAWADAAVICPWTIYLCYGDKRILERCYETMRKFVEWRVKTSANLVHWHACFGDWLAIDLVGNDVGKSLTPRDIIATAYFARTAEILSKAAAVIGKRAEAKKYAALYGKIKAVFNREFVSPAGRVLGGTQTSYLLALGFNLLPKNRRAYAAERLVNDIRNRGWHLSTGFVWTPLLAPVLTAAGRTDAAYRLLLQDTYPSWLYTVAQGATTMWERWNSWTKEKGFGDVGMNSFNHYAYGAIGEWMYNTVAGLDLDPEKPGYKHIVFRPQPGGEFTHAKAELKTRYGKAVSAWKRQGKKVHYEFVAPPNTTATIILPGRKPVKVSAGSYSLTA